MRMHESREAAESQIDALELADRDDYKFRQALLDDEAFCAAAYLYKQTDLYTSHEHATQADREARDALRRSIREHAQRVKQEVDH